MDSLITDKFLDSEENINQDHFRAGTKTSWVRGRIPKKKQYRLLWEDRFSKTLSSIGKSTALQDSVLKIQAFFLWPSFHWRLWPQNGSIIPEWWVAASNNMSTPPKHQSTRNSLVNLIRICVLCKSGVGAACKQYINIDWRSGSSNLEAVQIQCSQSMQ